MRIANVLSVLALAGGCLLSAASGCSSKTPDNGNGGDGGTNGSGSGGSSSGDCTSLTGCGGGSGGASSGAFSAPQVTCPQGTGMQCTDCSACPTGKCTQISGTVYDPAGKNPVWGVAVYVPNGTGSLPHFTDMVTCAGCGDLYPPTILASALTDEAGNFTINAAPASTMPVPLVVQIGKWRKVYMLPQVSACANNGTPMKLTLPSQHSDTDPTIGSIPNIAIATGGADSLECLPLRMGVDPSEYTGDPQGQGRIKIFPGYNGAATNMPAADPGQFLWDSTDHLKQYDVALLSCEGRETVDSVAMNSSLTDSSRQNLLNYANSGGRVFASHYHYAWFNTGPFKTATSPAMASWLTGANSIDDGKSFPANVITTLANGMPFPEGASMQKWLQNVGALTGGKLPINYTRHNVDMLNSPPAQAWLTLDQSSPVPNTVQYFSIDAPFAGAGGGSGESSCGRVVYSDLHVSGGPNTNLGAPPDYAGFSGGKGGVVPSGCAMHDLTPQEKALEFMLFDLTSCLTKLTDKPAPPMVH